ncbi:MAG: MprA protease, GlyGly-CTERM protein-sorting domain-containing form [Bifidobacteriaceae bacterium]|nr:MprA protease, GlyGly-CTERM protein-sorting domain-containing form [Bifidobacteriaceae bacterium]
MPQEQPAAGGGGAIDLVQAALLLLAGQPIDGQDHRHRADDRHDQLERGHNR